MAKVYIGTGRRKSSVAQVKMTSGKGKITVNGVDVDSFCNLFKGFKTTFSSYK